MDKFTITAFETMRAMLARNPVRGMRMARETHLAVNQAKYEIAGIACEATRMMLDDNEYQEDFYDEDFWEGRQRARPSKLLLHVLMYIYGAHKGAEYKRASEHSRALRKVCGDRDIPIESIPTYIAEHGGFDGLLSEENRDDDGEEEDSVAVDPTSGNGQGGASPTPTPRPAQKTIAGANVAQHDEDEHDDDDDSTDDDGADDQDFIPPTRKPTKPDKADRKWALLTRAYIEGCVIARPKNETDRNAILQAMRQGKKINADLLPGKVSPDFELYKGGRGFIELVIGDYAIG